MTEKEELNLLRKALAMIANHASHEHISILQESTYAHQASFNAHAFALGEIQTTIRIVNDEINKIAPRE